MNTEVIKLKHKSGEYVAIFFDGDNFVFENNISNENAKELHDSLFDFAHQITVTQNSINSLLSEMENK